mmetsp:Transcript_28726/g.88030  ORF Transcript_28726/g.88030 Transcript_28726/m.88030 type:complete len:118 (-) Transcript_28726:2632-2985(-)
MPISHSYAGRQVASRVIFRDVRKERAALCSLVRLSQHQNYLERLSSSQLLSALSPPAVAARTNSINLLISLAASCSLKVHQMTYVVRSSASLSGAQRWLQASKETESAKDQVVENVS